jgi:hypothetical protein
MDDKTTADKQSDPKNTRIVIPPEGISRIEKEGQIQALSDDASIEVEDALNQYHDGKRRDRDGLSAREEKAHKSTIARHVNGLLKFAGGLYFDERIAKASERLFYHANVPLHEMCTHLKALERRLAIEADAPKGKGGRPADRHLAQLFCALEDIYTRVGGRVTGVMKREDSSGHYRFCLFVNFVNAVLRSGPDGVGPSTWEAVAVAWERQWQRRRALQKAQSQETADPVSDSCQEVTQHQRLKSLSQRSEHE